MSSKQQINSNNKSSKKPKKKKKNHVFRNIFLTLLVVAFGIGGALAGIGFGWIQSAPSIDGIQIQPENYTSQVVYEKNGKEIIDKELTVMKIVFMLP